MSWSRAAAAAVIAISVAGAGVAAQDAVPQPTPEQIKQQLETIKKGKTLPIFPAVGTDDGKGETVLQIENTSPFDLVVLVVGPVSQRVALGPYRTETLMVMPGDYEIAVTAPSRTQTPSFYGRQTITEKQSFRHTIVIPVV